MAFLKEVRILVTIIFTLYVTPFFALEITSSSDSLVTCSISTTSSNSSLDFEVCVRIRSQSSLEVRWYPPQRVHVKGLGRVRRWQLSVSTSEDGRQVSYNALALSVDRFVVRSLVSNTSYDVFLEGMSRTYHYITRLTNPIRVRTPERAEEDVDNIEENVDNSEKNVDKSEVKIDNSEETEGDAHGGGKISDANGVATSAKSEEDRRSGFGLLWWIGVSSGAGFVLILILSGVTVCLHRNSKRSAKCPHIERELSEVSHSSGKAKDVGNTSSDKTAVSSRRRSSIGDSENNYVSHPQRRLPAPPPDVIITTFSDTDAANGNNSNKDSNRLVVSSDDNRESTVYARISDLPTSDPDPRSGSRIISVISWGSEFDILDERPEKVYNNTGNEIYNNATYGNLQATSVEPPPPRPPRPAAKTERPSASNQPQSPDPNPYLTPVKRSFR